VGGVGEGQIRGVLGLSLVADDVVEKGGVKGRRVW